jgi:hypothetical protein
MPDAELHLFKLAVRGAVADDPKTWRPLERALNQLIRENPFNTGPVGDALEELVYRDPRFMDLFDNLLNGPDSVDEWHEVDCEPNSDPNDEAPGIPISHASMHADAPGTAPADPTPMLRSSEATIQPASLPRSGPLCNTLTAAPETPTPQNATLWDTVAGAVFRWTPQNATLCHTASAVEALNPSQHPTENEAPTWPADITDGEAELGARVHAHFQEAGREDQAEADACRAELFRESEDKGGYFGYISQAKPSQETADPAPSKLKVKQQLAIAALLGGASMSAAAQAAGVDRSTLYRWLKRDAEFVAAYNRVKHDHYDAIHARMFQITNQMMDTLENLLNRPFSATADRLRMISVGLQLRKQIMAEKAPDCPTEAKLIASEWNKLGVLGTDCHEFPQPSAADSAADEEHDEWRL